MKNAKGYRFLLNITMGFALLVIVGACDSGKKAVDEVTGNRAVRQYHKAKKDADRIADRQTQRYEQIVEDEKSATQEKK
ncbi:MAG: hypothetical protein P8175_01335 [Deltaproteobacteria bacterium]